MKSIDELKNILFEESAKHFSVEDVEHIKNVCNLCEKYAVNIKVDGEEIRINPYQHSLKVAIILEKELNLDIESVVVALLMYCNESEEISKVITPSAKKFIQRIQKIFNIEIADFDKNVEYFRKLLVNISEDLRVLMLCLVDRLITMRELVQFSKPLQDTFSTEVMEIFAPLAHRIGLYNIYTELCNRSFKHFHNAEFEKISNIREKLIAERQSLIDNFVQSIDNLLKENGYYFHIKYRVKSPYSIWKKLEEKNIPIEEIYDIFAVRVIFELPDSETARNAILLDKNIDERERHISELLTLFRQDEETTANVDERRKNQENRDKEIETEIKSLKKLIKEDKARSIKMHEVVINAERATCWKIYALVVDKYSPMISRTRDWVTNPRPNGYESLHTTLSVSENTFVELQIRSKRMDNIAEYGVAAHWQYKEKVEASTLENWLSQVRLSIENSDGKTKLGNVLEEYKPKKNDIFVFTPDKEIRRMPAGATILDFAYEIHSQVGNKCVGGIVNCKQIEETVNGKTVKKIIGGTNVEKAYKIQNGETISIRTAKNQKPALDWLKLVVTAKAKYNIRKCLNEDYQEQVEIGKDILKRKLKNWKYDFVEHFNDIVNHFGYRFGTELYYDIATEKLNTLKIKTYLDNKSVLDTEVNIIKPSELIDAEQQVVSGNKSNYVLVNAEDGKRVRGIATKCCESINCGENVFGFFSTTGEIKIHKATCPNASDLKKRFPYRIVQLIWKRIDS